MASAFAFSEEEISGLLARVEMIPCFDQETVLHYKVSAVNIVANYSCSSSFEAATKFGLFLLHAGIDSSSSACESIEIICECEESKEILSYNLLIGENHKPTVSLLRVVNTSTTVLDDRTETQADKFTLPSWPSESHAYSNSDDTHTAKEHDLSSEEHLVQSTLENVFHYDALKPLQKEIISATVAGKNVLGVLGTGGGKTLTFMLPAILSDM